MPEPPAEPTVRSRIAHLFRRAGFGARPAELNAAVAAGYRTTVDRLLDFAAPDPGVAHLAPPAVDVGPGIVVWWLKRMAMATNPLPEKLTLFWHGHSPPR